jgi:hypothetical protein
MKFIRKLGGKCLTAIDSGQEITLAILQRKYFEATELPASLNKPQTNKFDAKKASGSGIRKAFFSI